MCSPTGGCTGWFSDACGSLLQQLEDQSTTVSSRCIVAVEKRGNNKWGGLAISPEVLEWLGILNVQPSAIGSDIRQCVSWSRASSSTSGTVCSKGFLAKLREGFLHLAMCDRKHTCKYCHLYQDFMLFSLSIRHEKAHFLDDRALIPSTQDVHGLS